MVLLSGELLEYHLPTSLKMLAEIHYAFTVIIVFLHINSVKANCEDKGCNAYACFDETANCGKDGYLLAFGRKYCERFKEQSTIDLFDEDGQKFLKCTTPCLIHNMQLYVDNATVPINCDDLSKSAFDMHGQCYLGCDFCKICKTNKWALIKSYDATDFFGLDAIKQVYRVISECGFFACF